MTNRTLHFRLIILLAAIAGLLPLAAGGQTAPAVYVARLSGNQEVLPVLSMASGEIRAELTDSTLVVSGHFSNLSSDFNHNIAGGAHIHRGFAGQNGGIQIALVATVDHHDAHSGEFKAEENTFKLTGDQLTLLRNRQFYVNVHSDNYPTGEIRGQLVPEADKIYVTNLFGSHEVPAVMTDGHGALVFELHGDTLIVTGAFSELESDFNGAVAGGSHIHSGFAGSNGSILFGLAVTLGADNRSGAYEAAANRFVLSQAQKATLEARGLYANIHTSRYTGGEIRGQIHKPATAVFRAFLSGATEVPSVLTGATGAVLLELEGDTLTASGSFRGLESDFNPQIAGGAHLHQAYAGSNGSVIFRLATTPDQNNRGGRFDAAANRLQLAADQLQTLLARRYYANVHTANFPSGEIRGQVLPESQYYLPALLSGTQENLPVLTDAVGGAVAEVMGKRLSVSGSFNNLGSNFNPNVAGGAHLHLGLAGTNGSIAVGLKTTANQDQRGGFFAVTDNTFDMRTGFRDSLRARGIYANVHTANRPSGEIRGQLLHEAIAYFFAPLSGTGEPAAVRTTGRGTVAAEWNGARLSVSGSFAQLGTNFNANIAGGAHIHIGTAGTNGSIRLPLKTELGADNRSGKFLVADNTFTPGAPLFDTLRARLTYANIHTSGFPGGEIRGQLLPPAAAYFTTTARGLNERPPVNSAGQGALKLELSGTRLVVTGSFSGLGGDFNPNIAGGSHLHLGTAAANGAISVELKPALAANGKGGAYLAADNTFNLTDVQLAALKSGGLYFNVHSTQVNSGEIRGQILHELNFYPNAPVITAPGTGAPLTIEGPATTAFGPTWRSASDPNGNLVVYVWQLDTSKTFTAPLVNVNTGTDTLFATNYGVVGALLTSAGIKPGQAVRFYHRVLASDGAVATPSAVDSVSLTLGVITAFDGLLAEQFRMQLYPVPANDRLEITFEATESAGAVIQLIDQTGRMVQREAWQLMRGANTRELDVSRLPAGAYFVQALIGGKPLRARQFTVNR